MVPTNRLALEAHEGPYETWPLRSRLLVDGAASRVRLPGYELPRQYELPSGYLLVTDWDCPYEEITHFILLRSDLRVRCQRWVGGGLEELFWDDDQHFTALVSGERWEFTIRPWGIPWLRPCLGMARAGS